MCRLPEEHVGCHLPVSGIERGCRLVCEEQGSFMGGHRASGTDSGSALPPFSGRVLIASILAWLTTPKTMHMQTALTQLIMALAHMEHADQNVAARLP